MTTYGYADNRQDLVKRVNRLEGQVRGIGRMIEEDRYCIDIVNQLSAVQSSARALALEILEAHIRHCVADAVRNDNAEPKIQELVETLGRALGR